MKQSIKRSICLMLCLIMLCSCCIAGVSAQDNTADSDSSYYLGSFYYRPGTGEYDPGVEFADVYAYSDDYFKHSGKEYDPHLATLSFALAAASVSSTREPFTAEGYLRKNRNAIAFLEDTGFSEISINNDYMIKPTKDTIGVACARKTIVENGKEYTLLAVFPRSAGYEAEWGNNFVLGADGNAKGFDDCANTCLAYAKDYIEAQGIAGDIKLWTVGYSRGASIANLIAGKLIDDPNGYLGDSVTLSSDDLYAYTCGTPSAADVDNDPRAEKYSGIFNHYLDTELASAMAPVDMGFDRYGTDFILYDEDRYEDMLVNLSYCNDYVYTTYKDEINSNQYYPKKVGIVDGSAGIADDNSSYIPYDPAEYLRGLCAYITQFTGGREEFARTYEQPFSDLLAYYESLTGERSSAFTNSLMNNTESLYMAAAMYAYFMDLKSEQNSVPDESQLRAKAEEIASVAADDSESIDVTMIADIAAKLGTYLLMDSESVKEEAAEYLSRVLNTAMKESGASDEEILNVTNSEASCALVHLISHLLFGNIWQSDNVYPLLLNNEQMKAAATLIGNAANLFVDHANEIIISWLKLYDSYYDDYTFLTDAQYAGYRRVYVKSEAAINGVITDGEGNTVAGIVNGAVRNSSDRWVGFTSTDDGGFLRIPADGDYQIKIDTDEPADIAVGIGEYDLYDAKTTMLFEETIAVGENETAVISLPALDNSYAMPSAVEYSAAAVPKDVYILGDVDLNGIVEITDAALVQRHAASIITLTGNSVALSDVDADGEITLLDATLIQYYLAEEESTYGIGYPI